MDYVFITSKAIPIVPLAVTVVIIPSITPVITFWLLYHIFLLLISLLLLLPHWLSWLIHLTITWILRQVLPTISSFTYITACIISAGISQVLPLFFARILVHRIIITSTIITTLRLSNTLTIIPTIILIITSIITPKYYSGIPWVMPHLVIYCFNYYLNHHANYYHDCYYDSYPCYLVLSSYFLDCCSYYYPKYYPDCYYD